MATQNWFINWFNSPYYHILYKNRDYKEAEAFIDKLIAYLNPPADAHFLDVACGKGRHSIYLNKKGYTVTGIDLSVNNIASAKRKAHNNLHFLVQDMRQPFKDETFDYVLNLFTSFGYFDEEGDNLKTLNAAYANLKQGGTLILDFFNSKCVMDNLMTKDEKKLDGITFKLHKKVKQGTIYKDIYFSDKGIDYHFMEKVKAYTYADLKELITKAGFTLKNAFGSYNLEPFNEATSDRLIIEAVK